MVTTTSTSPSPQTVPPARDEASTDPTPRMIDENTDLSTLTDQEIMRLTEQMGQDDVDASTKPLISAPVPLMVIKEEYKNGSSQVLKKLEWLQNNGWDQVWRARGDGDCFYRSFTIAYLLRILHDPDPPLAANHAFDAIQRSMPAMEASGFDMELAKDFVDPLLELVRTFDSEQQPNEYSLIQSLQDPERSNSIVCALRLITSAYIRTNPTQFLPFLFNPFTFEQMDENEFCRSEVEPCGKEADQVQITALSEALEIGIKIAYLDRSDLGSGDEVINWVEFGKTSDEPLTLLYRPGHFDVVTKDTYMQAK